MSAHDWFFDKVQKLANEGFQYVADLDGRDRKGCYLYVVYKGEERRIAVGSPESNGEQLRQRWWNNCQRKANRLIANPLHISAKQSADPSKEEYYGGIRIPSYDDAIITCSAFIEDLDEAFCASIGAKLNNGLDNGQWWEIVRLSGNPYMLTTGKVSAKSAA